ncbi:MAG: bifunctional folylpolyglutamate synthase/dihydrofolate synthase [Candidatus Anammoxibacter sp.]
MNYQQTLDYLYSQLPIYQRIGKAAYKADLNNTIAICDVLGNPQNDFKSIHIAGTNGKGSTAHILASILQSSGLKTGLYTSPHLKDFRERIRINGEMITKDKVCGFVESYKTDFEKIKPSFFEMTVALAFDYFAGQEVDIAVIETGLGGRLDSTNIITPVLSVITNIGMDHTEFLGDTLEKIAGEKAGIIKQNVPVVIGETQEEIKQVFLTIAEGENAKLFFTDKEVEKLETDLLGHYQKKNIITALKSIDVLNQNGFTVTDMQVKEGLKNVVKNTGLLGRWQVLSRSPLIICDAAHNVEGLLEILPQIRSTPHKMLHFVLGMVKDKDIDPMLKLLPKNAAYYFCKADIPRGMNQNELREKAKKHNLSGKAYTSVKEALQNAISIAKRDDLVFVGGSSFVVAEVV